MNLYIFSDSVTGELQQPFLAHNDDEAIRIARLSFAPVPHAILSDLIVCRVLCYDAGSDPAFSSLINVYGGANFIRESEEHND